METKPKQPTNFQKPSQTAFQEQLKGIKGKLKSEMQLKTDQARRDKFNSEQEKIVLTTPLNDLTQKLIKCLGISYKQIENKEIQKLIDTQIDIFDKNEKWREQAEKADLRGEVKRYRWQRDLANQEILNIYKKNNMFKEAVEFAQTLDDLYLEELEKDLAKNFEKVLAKVKIGESNKSVEQITKAKEAEEKIISGAEAASETFETKVEEIEREFVYA